MIQAIQPLTQFADPEYIRIKQDLMKLGGTPTGSKEIDKNQLEDAKLHLIDKIKEREVNKTQELQAQPLAPVDNVQDSKKAEMEQQRLGAMTVAELNKIYFGL